MQLKDRDGIACDYCGMQHRSDFSYYSWDFRNVSMNGGKKPPLNHMLNSGVIFSLDICTACFDKFKNKIVENYKKTMDKKSRTVVCELSGSGIVGNCNFYYVEVTKVEVKITGQPSICVKCEKRTFDTDKPCKCGSDQFVCAAATTQDKRFVEVHVSSDSFDHLKDKAEQVRKMAGEWATSS